MTSSGSGMPAGRGMRRGGWGNVPLPEPHLLAIAAGVWLDRKRPWPLPGRRSVHYLAGWPLVGAGVYLVGRSWKAAAQVHLERPALLVTTGPYAVSRNPMYVGWALLHLGTGLARGSGWMLAALPVAAAQVHREVHREERTLDEVFGEDFRHYRATVPRYLYCSAAHLRYTAGKGVDGVCRARPFHARPAGRPDPEAERYSAASSTSTSQPHSGPVGCQKSEYAGDLGG